MIKVNPEMNQMIKEIYTSSTNPLDQYMLAWINQLEDGLKYYADKEKYKNFEYWQIVNDAGKTARKSLGVQE